MPELLQARETLARIGWLNDVPIQFKKILLSHTSLRYLAAGETLQVDGEDAIGMYGVSKGMLRASVSMKEHGPYFVHLFRQGDWIGEGPSITARPRIISVTTACEVSLLFLPQGAIRDIIQRNPIYLRYFFALLQEHLELSVGALADALIRDHSRRMIAVLLRLGKCRDGASDSRGRVEVLATQEEIALMANAGRTATSAILQELAQSGLIEIGYGRIILLAPKNLRALIRQQTYES